MSISAPERPDETKRYSADGRRVCNRCGGPLRAWLHFGDWTGYADCSDCVTETWDQELPAGIEWVGDERI